MKLNAGNDALYANPIEAKKGVRPLGDRVIVRDMNFDGFKTNGGIYIMNDDGKDRGIKPRWGRVVSKGPDNTDPFEIGDWILVEHGRWTRGFKCDIGEEEPVMLRTIEAESILGYTTEEPQQGYLGSL